ncbi:hypothetical protein RJT34_10909 [Clitoria ternatea]|uniref:Uncharacterized protein n=1 Tax=Clitoria ternatea TaxID=43366 RepID=A0AAN9PK11_CLITE
MLVVQTSDYSFSVRKASLCVQLFQRTPLKFYLSLSLSVLQPNMRAQKKLGIKDNGLLLVHYRGYIATTIINILGQDAPDRIGKYSTTKG